MRCSHPVNDLQSSVELIRVQIGDEQQEKLVMENELESLNKRLEEVQQSYLDKLDKIKAQYGDRLMDATNLERKKKLSELKFRIKNMEMDQRTQALKEWMSFKEVVVMFAEQQVKYRAEHKKEQQLNTAIQTYNKTIKHVEADCTQKRQSKRGENVLCWSLPSTTIQDQMISGTSKFSQLSVQQNFTSSKILDNQWQTAQHCPDAIMAVTRGQDLQQSHTSVTANIRGQEKAQQLTSVKPDSHSQDTQQLLAPLTADRERQDTDIIEDYQRNDIQQCPIPVTKDFQRLHKKQCSSPTLTHDQKMDTVLGFTPKTRNDQREVIQQSLTSDIQGQQMRGTLQPRQMFSSSLSRLKLKMK
ncbi:uncharacterized protein LOC121863327 [Homarus americanus]|uniref:uncharacterized protein LOC121863327 n=1 Tax=Homarus americanus TaxID=6706 RepID=UPI001C463001|nr:uncharacterized protein LOC121863327 [Homarus americanus]